MLTSQYIQMATATTLALLVFSVSSRSGISCCLFTTGLAQAFGGPAYRRSSVARRQKTCRTRSRSIRFSSTSHACSGRLRRHDCGIREWGFTDAQGMAAASR
jgi:hypothetical protein